MLDIAIDNRGDIISKTPQQFPTIKLKWKMTGESTFRILFKTHGDKKKAEGFNISFRTSNDSIQTKTASVWGEDELKQRILILLRTQLGDIETQPDYGTELVNQKHLDITDQRVLQKVHDIVFNAVSPLLDDPRIYVQKKITEGPFYCQNIDIYIYDGKKEIYNFEMEA